MQCRAISQLGSLDQVAQLILPRGAKLLDSSSRKVQEPDRDLIDLALQQPPQQIYRHACLLHIWHRNMIWGHWGLWVWSCWHEVWKEQDPIFLSKLHGCWTGIAIDLALQQPPQQIYRRASPLRAWH